MQSDDMPNIETDDLDIFGLDTRTYNIVMEGLVLCGLHKLESIIGRGGMSVVWIATEIASNKLVVVKMIPQELQKDPNEIRNVKDNYCLIEQLHHSNLCPVRGLFYDNTVGYYLVMKYIEGVSLAKYMRSYSGNLNMRAVLQIVQPIANALDYSHSLGIIHRDIKPLNIILSTSTLEPVIIDFGLAIYAKQSNLMSVDGSGTPSYKSPEQWTGQAIDFRSDQYSLAVVVYELLSGDIPFPMSDIRNQRSKVLNECAMPIESISEKENTVILKALSKNPDNRFLSCTEFISCLSSSLELTFNDPTINEVANFTLKKSFQNILTRVSARELSPVIISIILIAIIWLGYSNTLEKSSITVSDTHDNTQTIQNKNLVSSNQAIKQTNPVLPEDDIPVNAISNDSNTILTTEPTSLEKHKSNPPDFQNTDKELAPKSISNTDEKAPDANLVKDGPTDQQIPDVKILRFELSWDTPVDLDLHVIDPDGNHLYWLNTITKNGGSYTSDSDKDLAKEAVAWEMVAPSGAYKWWVEYNSNRGLGDKTTNWKLTINDDDKSSEFHGILFVPATKSDDSVYMHVSKVADQLIASATANQTLIHGTSPDINSKVDISPDDKSIIKPTSSSLSPTSSSNIKDPEVDLNRIYLERTIENNAFSGQIKKDLQYAASLIKSKDRVNAERLINDSTNKVRSSIVIPKELRDELEKEIATVNELLALLTSVTPGNDATDLQINKAITNTPKDPISKDDKQFENSIGMSFTLIPSGDFIMGNSFTEDELAKSGVVIPTGHNLSHESPTHKVSITNSFYIGTFEVSEGQFAEFVKQTNYVTDAEKISLTSEMPSGGFGLTQNRSFIQSPSFNWRNYGYSHSDRFPVVNISWNDAFEFCKWLSSKENKVYRLPSEAEWEYVTRGGSQTIFSNGNNPELLIRISNIADESLQKEIPTFTHTVKNDNYPFAAPIGSFLPNQFGVYDMLGNVWEWVNDKYSESYYKRSPIIDPKGPDEFEGLFNVRRGGGWFSDPRLARSSCRDKFLSSSCGIAIGFRVVLER